MLKRVISAGLVSVLLNLSVLPLVKADDDPFPYYSQDVCEKLRNGDSMKSVDDWVYLTMQILFPQQSSDFKMRVAADVFVSGIYKYCPEYIESLRSYLK